MSTATTLMYDFFFFFFLLFSLFYWSNLCARDAQLSTILFRLYKTASLQWSGRVRTLKFGWLATASPLPSTLSTTPTPVRLEPRIFVSNIAGSYFDCCSMAWYKLSAADGCDSSHFSTPLNLVIDLKLCGTAFSGSCVASIDDYSQYIFDYIRVFQQQTSQNRKYTGRVRIITCICYVLTRCSGKAVLRMITTTEIFRVVLA